MSPVKLNLEANKVTLTMFNIGMVASDLDPMTLTFNTVNHVLTNVLASFMAVQIVLQGSY